MRAKYLSYFSSTGMGFVAWASELSHEDMAKAMKATTVRSAGFMGLMPTGDLHCDGHSVSLDIAADPNDSALANKIFKSE